MEQNRSKLHFEIDKTLQEKSAFGQSRHKAKEDGSDKDKIFSYASMKQYKRQCRYFADYVRENYPKTRHVGQAKKYAGEYLEHLIDEGKSPSTIQTARSALSKLFGETIAQELELPEKTRATITNNRSPEREYLKHFSETKNAELVNFCKKTGLRKHELKQLTGDCLREIDGNYYLLVKKGKGGKQRLARVLDNDNQVIQRMKNTAPDGLVWTKENGWKEDMTPHKYRADYATAFYNEIARPAEALSEREKYYCRNDMAGKVFDRKALLEVSKNLGHNRISVIAGNYAYKM